MNVREFLSKNRSGTALSLVLWDNLYIGAYIVLRQAPQFDEAPYFTFYRTVM